MDILTTRDPVLSLNLDDPAIAESVLPAPLLTLTQLLALLDKAKAFPLLKKQQPDCRQGCSRPGLAVDNKAEPCQRPLRQIRRTGPRRHGG